MLLIITLLIIFTFCYMKQIILCKFVTSILLEMDFKHNLYIDSYRCSYRSIRSIVIEKHKLQDVRLFLKGFIFIIF